MNFLRNKWFWLTVVFLALTPLVWSGDTIGAAIFFPVIPLILWLAAKVSGDIRRKELRKWMMV